MGIQIELIAGGGKDRTSMLHSRDARFEQKLLLVDADGPAPREVAGQFYMVQAMESWLVADWDIVAQHFNYNGKSTLRNKNIEEIPNKEIIKILDGLAAPRGKRHDTYHKVVDGLALLHKVRLEQVRTLNHGERFYAGVMAAIDAL